MACGLWNSRVRGSEIQRSERLFGYFAGPCMMAMVSMGTSGNYLIQFYTDVLDISGMFLAVMPLVSRLIAGCIGLWLGRMIEETRTPHGKARPYLLLSGLLMTTAVLLYAVPNGSYRMKLVWVTISYNVFFSLIHAVYSLSHSMMVPLSSRNTEQRDSLALLSSVATSILPGALAMVGLPLLISRIGVGEQAEGAWLSVMGAISVLAVPAAMMEYYFTLERVVPDSKEKAESSFRGHLAVCMRNDQWRRCMMFVLALNVANAFSGGSMIYYCNWVLGRSVAEGAVKQILVNVIGQLPMGVGVLLLWPLVGSFGKRRVTCIGFAMASVGSLAVLLSGSCMPAVLAGLIIRSFGSLPVYLLSAHQAEALDSVERETGIRADGLTASMIGFFQAIAPGAAQTMLLFGMDMLGYIAPESAAHAAEQNDAVRMFFECCFALVPMIGYAVCSLSMRAGRRNVDGGGVK